MIEVSVIIPTYNGARKIGKILDSLLLQKNVKFEIIVVVDGSTDNTLEVLESYNSNFNNLRVLNQKNGGRSIARNNGAKLACGDLLVFFDDDMRLGSNALLAHVKHHLNYPSTYCIGKVWEDEKFSITDIQKYRAHCSRKWSLPLEENNGLINKSKPYLTSANFSIPKEIFWRVGGFDERLTDAEDYDLGVRLCLGNIDSYYNKESLTWHDDYITLKSYVKRLREYKLSHEKLKKIKPELYVNQFKDYDYNEIEGIKKMIYSIFSTSFWVKIIELDIIRFLMPQNIRYKLYDVTVTSLSVYNINKVL